jgi:hypothetical protein
MGACSTADPMGIKKGPALKLVEILAAAHAPRHVPDFWYAHSVDAAADITGLWRRATKQSVLRREVRPVVWRRPLISHLPGRDTYSVSRFQERQVLFERQERREGRQRADNIYLAYRISGPLNIPALRHAVENVARRHEPLRTCFPPGEEQPPVAWVQPAGDVLDVLPSQAAADPEDAARSALRRCVEEPFDIQRGPLFRAVVLPLSRGEHLFVLCLDHVAGDGIASLGLLHDEVAARYVAYASGAEPDLPPLPFEYGDFAVAHRSWLTPELRAEILNHWRPRLPPHVAEPELNLPALTPGSERSLGRSAVARLALDDDLTRALPEIRRRYRATSFMVFGTALLAAQRAWSGEEHVGMLFPIDLRAGYGAQALFGRFSNLSVLWLPISRDRALGDLLQEVKSRTHAAMRYSDMPFGEIVRELYPGWYGSVDTPPYVFFQVRAAPPASWQAGAVTARPVRLPVDHGTQLHPGVKVQVHTDTADISCQYAAAAYAPEVVDGLLGRMADAVRLLHDRPESSVADLASRLRC